MAGKSNKGRNRGKGSNAVNSAELATEPAALSEALKEKSGPVEPSQAEANGVEKSDAAIKASELVDAQPESADAASAASGNRTKQADGDLHLYPVSVKTQCSEKLELQLNPGDSVMDLRQFLLDAPETCFFTCYDLILHTKDGSSHHLEDYNEISEVADITAGGCSLEMVAALYDDRSIRAHVRRARELLSLSTLHASLSTSLALQHETMQQKSADAAKIEIAEHDGLGFLEDATGSLDRLVSPLSKEIKCVESIVFSSFNPPPSYRRLVGDLLYLDVVTLEGNKLCITGTTKAFYVNSSIGSMLDPRPSKPAYEANTLIGLLQKVSSKFKKGFREILDRKASAHPFENVQSLLPANSWLGLYPIPDHKRDAARAEDSLALSFGSELIGMQRDWNEELQSCREFPHASLQERILRDRALYKVTCDFVDAAISGAVGVISRCIPPINPTDPECFHMYVHNNIFFSFAVDADLGQMFKENPSSVKCKFGQDAEHSDHSGSPFDSLDPASDNQTTDDLKRQKHDSAIEEVPNVVTDTSSEVQMADSEQATYASANNDLKGTRAYQEADVPELYNLAMAIIDYRGHRVVAQSIIPGILQGDKSDSLLYGSVDNGKKICWNETFHSKVKEAAKRLHLKEHAVIDGSGNIIKLAAPVECKGIVGSDDRHYLLDLMRVTPRDANYTGPGSRFCVLRPELVSAFAQAEATEKSKFVTENDSKVSESLDSESAKNHDAEVSSDTKDVAAIATSQDTESEELVEPVKKCDTPAACGNTVCKEILFNPNVFTEFKLAGSEEMSSLSEGLTNVAPGIKLTLLPFLEMKMCMPTSKVAERLDMDNSKLETAADEEIVRKAAKFLTDVVLPKFVHDLDMLEVTPMDGQTLTEALHAHGINVRYIGKVADMTKHLPHVWNLCVVEIVVRSAKHILKDVMRESQDHDLGPAISHFFNCFIGDILHPSAKGSANNVQARTNKKDPASYRSMGKSFKGQAKSNQALSTKRTQSAHLHLTSESLWSEIHEFAKFKYQFDLPEDARLLVKKIPAIRNLCQKVGIAIAARKYDFNAAAPFQISDILDLQPVVKHSVPVCAEARDLVETGKARLAEGMLNEAYTLFTEAFSILQQVTGPMHREVANCCRYLAMVLYHVGDMAGAVMQQHKELIINERCLGLDHPDTAHSYGNMALFYHGLNQTELALRHMSRTLLLLGLSCGPDHPDVAATFINVAMMYQDIGRMNVALRYLQEALTKNERLLGQEHIQTAVCYHALAIAFNCMGTFKLSLQHEKKTYDILVKQLGEEDSRTRDSQNWIKTFQMREQQVLAQRQKGQAGNAASTQKAMDILRAFQAAAGGSGNASSSINKSVNAAIIGESLPRGRGIDERAARAAAGMRKKAAAKGLPVRSLGAPVQALPQFTQLLNIFNSGVVQEASGDTQTAEPKKAANGPSMNGNTNNRENGSADIKQEQAPVGLGTSLASLDSKKQKQKTKSTT